MIEQMRVVFSHRREYVDFEDRLVTKHLNVVFHMRWYAQQTAWPAAMWYVSHVKQTFPVQHNHQLLEIVFVWS